MKQIPMEDIYSDDKFNSRDKFTPLTVKDLADDIKDKGLLSPIIVQPYTEKPGKRYRIVTGHRRFAAYQVLQRTEIECIVRTGLTEQEAFQINVAENLQRKDLSVMEEAHAIERFTHWGCSYDEISREVKKSIGWVQTRLQLLRLPAPIQNELAVGAINVEDVKMISAYKTEKEQFEYVRAVKDAKARGVKLKMPRKKHKVDPLVKREPAADIRNIMQDEIYEQLGPSIVTRTLAWVNGHISLSAFIADIDELAAEDDKSFIPPDDFIQTNKLSDKR